MTKVLAKESLEALTEQCKELNSSMLTGKGLIMVRMRRFSLDGDELEPGQKFNHLTKLIVNIQGASSVARALARQVVDKIVLPSVSANPANKEYCFKVAKLFMDLGYFTDTKLTAEKGIYLNNFNL